MSFLQHLVQQMRDCPSTHNDVMNAVVTGECLRGRYGAQDKEPGGVLWVYDRLLVSWRDRVDCTLDEMRTWMLEVIDEAHEHEPDFHHSDPHAQMMHPLSELMDLTRILAAGVRGGWWGEADAEKVAHEVAQYAATLSHRKDATATADSMWMLYHDPDYDVTLYEWVHTLAWCSPEMNRLRADLVEALKLKPRS